MRSVVQTARLLRLFWADARAQYVFALLVSVAIPLTVSYLALLVYAEGAGSTTRVATLGMTLAFTGALTRVGSTVLQDRFGGRLAAIRSLPISKRVYYASRVGIGVFETTLLFAIAIGLLSLLGIASASPRAILYVMLSGVCASSSLCGLGAVVSMNARDAQTGWLGVSLVGIVLITISPVLYSPDALSGWARSLSWLSPYTHVPPQIESVLTGTAPEAGPLLGSASLAAVLNLLAFRALKW